MNAAPDTLFDALDLPPEAHALQDAYWQARREWQEKDAAFHIALTEILARAVVVPPPSGEART